MWPSRVGLPGAGHCRGMLGSGPQVVAATSMSLRRSGNTGTVCHPLCLPDALLTLCKFGKVNFGNTTEDFR